MAAKIKRKMQAPFRTPEEIENREKTDQVSARLRASAIDVLKKAADSRGESLSWLVGRVLEDYADWLESQSPKKR